MRTSLQQSAVLKQELRMNPRLYQAMDLLYMPLLDLQQHLKQEFETNPFLELADGEDPDVVETKETEEKDEEKDEVDWEDILLDGFSVGGAKPEYEEKEYYQPQAVEATDLADHLRDQLQLLEITERQMFLSEEFIGNVGDDGYLRASLDEIVEGANGRREDELRRLEEMKKGRAEAEDENPLTAPYGLDEAEALLGVIQQLDPAGVGARDLRECLLLQLVEDGLQETLTYRLVNEAFDDLIGHRWTELAKRYGLSPKEVQSAADELARLDPKPGLRFAGKGDEYVVPDLVVEKVEGEYRVFLNDGGMPRLRISKVYRDLASDKAKFQGENREFITQKLNSATWLIQAIEQRRQTMLRVMYFIVDRQREFFEKGVEHLRPLTLREVAEVLDLHESTVSRVTSRKYVQTPRGVYPLKFFFSSSVSTTTGEDASSRAVKAHIGKLVADEDQSKPLTDAAIVTALKRRGIQIARRTVAKYREQLGILPARMRKRV
ncbi:MAG: RNA polymerase factor sigma-54 [Gemmatimonadales bacterium]